MLTVYIDFKSAPAYLAIAPTISLADRLGLELDWRPFRTVERDVPKLGKEETVGESHRRVRAASQRALNVKYAAHQGIDLRYPEPLGESDLALGTLLNVAGDRLPYIQAAFQAYWTDHQDLDDETVVTDLLNRIGASYDGDLGRAKDDLVRAQIAAEEAGIVGAPAYVIEEQIFVGREHLPWIAEIASERTAEAT
nr:DsbA family protein [Hyphomonas sp. Mor2]